MKFILCVLFFLFSLAKTKAITQDTIIIKENLKQITCDGKESYFYSNTDLPYQTFTTAAFKSMDSVNLQYITGWVWVKFTIKNNSSKQQFVLTASSGHISGFYIYKPTSNGYVMSPAKLHHPEDGREIYNRLPSFFLDIKHGETKTFYVKIRVEDEVAHFSFVIRDNLHFIEYAQADHLILGLYFGALLIIIIINIFYFVSLRDSLFLVYAIYVFGNICATSTFDGFSWLLIRDPDLAYHVSFFGLRFWIDSLLFFAIQLVNLKNHNKILTVIAYTYLCYHALIMAILELTNAFNIRYEHMGNWELVNCLIGLTLVFVIMIASYKKNKYLFKYYVIAFGTLFLSAIILPLYGLANYKNYLLFQHGLKMGTLTEIITLSFAVSRRFKLTENDLKQKQEEKEQLTDKVKQLEMNARKAQMNPHFMFNALSSIEYFIFKNNPDKARNYLGNFAELMRLTLNNSRIDYISIADDLNALKFYIELEFLRLDAIPHHLEIKVDRNVDIHSILIPALLIQPFAENAILHGLQTKLIPGHLCINLYFEGNELHCIIEDDGGGIKKMHQSHRKSSGIQITKERLTLIHELLNTSYRFSIEDIKDDHEIVTGTRVDFNMPYVTENDY